MNLIQIQERLKDLPLQVIMAYANGANPEVEPYLALLEMNRRKRIEQQAQPAEPPTGTVKDQLEQQAGLAALQQMRMGQAQQQMMQGAAAQPMPVPEGAPQPEQQPQPEMSGIASAAAQPGVMRPDVMRMAGGGIVAFARGGDSEDDEDEDEDDGEDEEAGAGYGGADTYTYESTVRPAVTGQASAVAPQGQIQARDLSPQAGPAGPGLRLPPQAAPAPQAAAAPQGLQSTAQQLAGLQALAAQKRAAVPQAPQMPTRESMARENPAMYGVLNKPVGQEYLAGLQALMAKQAAEDPKALEQLERNKRMAFFKALIDAGEATRGQTGLGPLAAGFGRSMIPALKNIAEEETGIRGLALKRDELLNKAKFDVEKLQRAQGEGDLKAEQKSKQDLFKSAVELYKSGNLSLAKEIAAIAGIEEAKIRAAAQTESARTRAAARSTGEKPQRITDEKEGVEDFYQARLARGEPPGPETRVKARQDYARTKGITSLEGTAARRDPAIDAELRKREMLNTKFWSMSEPEKQAWRTAERDKIIADIEAGRLRLMGAPGSVAPTTAPAPGAAPRTRLKFDAEGNLQQ